MSAQRRKIRPGAVPIELLEALRAIAGGSRVRSFGHQMETNSSIGTALTASLIAVGFICPPSVHDEQSDYRRRMSSHFDDWFCISAGFTG